MIEQGYGSIVNLSSTFGERGSRGAGLYVASEHAVNGFTRSALGDGRVLSERGRPVLRLNLSDRTAGLAELARTVTGEPVSVPTIEGSSPRRYCRSLLWHDLCPVRVTLATPSEYSAGSRCARETQIFRRTDVFGGSALRSGLPTTGR
jgi:hypothetical protein